MVMNTYLKPNSVKVLNEIGEVNLFIIACVGAIVAIVVLSKIFSNS